MKKAVVTGANGFVGTALCKELTSQGVEVIAVVRNEKRTVSDIKNLPGLRIVCCDISNFINLADYIKDRDVDVLYHLAWIGSSGPLRGEEHIQLKNVQYTCDIVRACSVMNCKRMIFAASIMEYEIAAMTAADMIPGINALYSSAKTAADHMARIIAGSLGIEYISAVISNIYGPGETNPRLVNISLRKLLSGVHCSFSSGNQIYDFVYITDAAKALFAVGRKGIAAKTYYIGSQNPRKLKEFLCIMRDLVDPSIEIGLGELPLEGISLTYKEFDIQAVKKDTGFISLTTFEEGIQNTIKWIKGERRHERF